MQRETGNRKQETGNARIRNPRWLWITSLVVGGICTIAFIAMWFAPTEPSAPGPTPAQGSGLGFGAGIVMGLAAGIAIGFAIARQARSRAP